MHFFGEGGEAFLPPSKWRGERSGVKMKGEGEASLHHGNKPGGEEREKTEATIGLGLPSLAAEEEEKQEKEEEEEEEEEEGPQPAANTIFISPLPTSKKI